MKAMLLDRIANLDTERHPLRLTEVAVPEPSQGQLLLRVSACGICHTELDEIEGRIPTPRLPVILGHQVVGKVEAAGPKVSRFELGARVGVAWIWSACGACRFCRQGLENLCPDFRATGRDADGGYAEYMAVPEAFAHPIPEAFTDFEAAPLLCAGAIGYRSLRLAALEGKAALGLTGFGASAHLVLKMVRHRHPSVQTFVFARSEKERSFALELGAVWAGDTDEPCPEKLDAVIDTTPAWKPIVGALSNLRPGGRLVVNAIRKEERDKASLQELRYPEHLWLEKEIKSVANVTRQDVQEFLDLAAAIPLRPEVQLFELSQANEALLELKERKIRGAKVLRIG